MMIILIFALFEVGCAKKAKDNTSAGYLYVASGLCYGANTTFTSTTASNVVFKVNLDTGAQEDTIADYNVSTETPGNTPVALQNYDGGHLMVLVDNTTSGSTGNKRLEKISKDGSEAKVTFVQNSSIFGTSGNMRSFKIFNWDDNALSDGSFFVAHGASVDRTSNIGTIIKSGTPSNYAWLSATSGSCQSNTNITSVDLLSNGMMLFAHAAASHNIFGVIAAAGYGNNASNCLASQAAPIATAYPTSLVYIQSANQVLVAYAGNSTATDTNSIYAYDIDESTGAISNATKAYENTNVLYGVTAMAYDQVHNVLYVATQNSTATTAAGYNIEKFNYDLTTKTLTRATTTPFSTHTYKTKCISSMVLDN
jgi:hypothetical protein